MEEIKIYYDDSDWLFNTVVTLGVTAFFKRKEIAKIGKFAWALYKAEVADKKQPQKA